MKPFFSKPFSFALILGLLFISAGCDSGSNDDDEISASFDQMGAMFEEAFNIFGDVAVDILLTASKSQPVYNCDQSGTVDWDVTSGTTNLYSLAFNDCNGISGSTAMGLTTSFDGTSVGFGMTLTGTLNESCTMTLNNFSMDVTSNQDGTDQILIGGGISSNCNGESFSCTFNDDQLSESSDDAFFQDRCSVSTN